ncbi:MAG: deoxyribodipyrimidine photo-lyase [Prolixibacteraceae bacterium]
MGDKAINIFWFRRDLRVSDNRGLYEALMAGKPVLPVFVFDSAILSDLEDNDSRLTFILREVQKLQDLFEQYGSSFWIYHGTPLDAFKRIDAEYEVDTVFANQDYEPYAVERDRQVGDFLRSVGTGFSLFKDHVVFHQDDILNESGKPYTVFTPYSKKWKVRLSDHDLQEYPSEKHLDELLKLDPLRKYHHPDLGFRPGNFSVPPPLIDPDVLAHYHERRDYPAEEGTTRLGIHLRFGTLSIRRLTAMALVYPDAFLNELIWRNFYIDILWHFPYVQNRSFNPVYDRIHWLNSEKDFSRWREGTTGYPMVDAGMRQLNLTGYMHNRVRMITAGFLCKHLLIDWRWGEAYFADKLLDYELASNNGGWQWAAGCGCDAAPYFRIFNPFLQQQTFDPKQVYIRKWLPEFGTADYPRPMIDHKTARNRALQVYREGFRK